MYSIFKYIFIALFIVTAFNGNAQKGSKSPYSVYGLGELKGGQYAYFVGLGGAQNATTDSTVISRSNPASYAFIGRNKPIFQIGLNGKYSNLVTANESAKTSYFGLDQFQLAFPIQKNWGGSLGLTPYSASGYLISNPIFEGTDTVAEKINEGKGTISNFHLGLSYKHNLWSKARIAFGANVNYIFGGLQKIESYEHTIYPDNQLHSRINKSTYMNGLMYDLGFLFEQNLYRNSFTIAGSFTPASSVKSSQGILATAYSSSFYQNYSYFSSITDTAQYSTEVEGVTYIPTAIKLGAEFRIKPCPGSSQSYLFIFKGDLNQQKWSNYYTEFDSVKTGSIYADRTNLAFGFEYTPFTLTSGNNSKIPYLGRIHYRLGANYTFSEIIVNNEQLTNYGISFGLGIPVLNGRSNTNINLGVSYNAFGTTENNLIKENNLGFSVGFSISPGLYDRWFLKRKYD